MHGHAGTVSLGLIKIFICMLIGIKGQSKVSSDVMLGIRFIDSCGGCQSIGSEKVMPENHTVWILELQ